MKRFRWQTLGLLAGFGLVGPHETVQADDPPAKTAKPADAKSEFAAIEKEFQKFRQDFFKKLQEMEDRTEQRKAYDEGFPKLIKPFVDRVLALDKQYPDDPATCKALLWLYSNTQNDGLKKTLVASIQPKIKKTAPDSLNALLGDANPMLGEIGLAVFNKTKDLPTDATLEKLLVWVAQSTVQGGPNGVDKAYNESIEQLVEKFPASKSFPMLTMNLSRDDNPKWAIEQFRKLLAKNKDGDNRLAAQFGLGMMLSNEDGGEKEAVTILEEFSAAAKDVRSMSIFTRQATAKLKDMKLINAPLPEIEGEDLDGKTFRISEYKGRVVLIDFWGFWCGPCVELIPHGRQLVKKLEGKPFTFIGVNSDKEGTDIKSLLVKHEVVWRSFKDVQKSKTISEEFGVQGWPTLILVDHKGVVRKKWLGNPGNELLDKAVEKLVEEAAKDLGK